MISKKAFVNILKLIQKEDVWLDKEAKAGEVLFPDTKIIKTSRVSAYLIEILNQEFDITHDLISWWLYEDVEKKVYKNNQAIDLKEPEDLYDFIVKEREIEDNGKN